jgi:hypothetical protein
MDGGYNSAQPSTARRRANHSQITLPTSHGLLERNLRTLDAKNPYSNDFVLDPHNDVGRRRFEGKNRFSDGRVSVDSD